MSAGALIEAISTTGSSTAAGLPNVNGQVFAYVPGTTTPTTIYSDAAATVVVTQPVVLDNAGRVPYATYPNGLYCTGPIRLFITDVNGSTVSDTTYQLVSGLVAINNSNFTGTTLDAVLNAAGASFGGQDFKYLGPGTGAVGRLVKSKFQEIEISVVDQGADPTGSAVSTAAIQNAVNAAIALGGGVVYFPPGTYKINAVITLAASTGITLRGAGSSASVVNQVTASTDCFSVSASTGLVIDGLGTTGGGVALTSATTCRISACGFASSNTYGLSTTNGNGVSVIDSSFSGSSESVFTSGTANLNIRGGSMGSSPIGIVVAGSSNQLYCSTVLFGGGTGVKWNSGASGSGAITPSFIFNDCPTLGGRTPFDVSALSSDPGISQRNCGMDLQVQGDLAAASLTVTPNSLYSGTQFIATSTSGANNITVNLPSPAPLSSQVGKTIAMYFTNSSGGTVNYLLNGLYLNNGTTPPTTPGIQFQITWWWDGTYWRLQTSGRSA